MNLNRLVLGVGVLTLSCFSSATTLYFHGTADDAFTASLSTSATSAGTEFASGTFWPNVQFGQIDLTPGVTNYLQVAAHDVYGLPSMFISSVELSDSKFKFSDGGTSDVTNATDWTASLSGFGGTPTTITEIAANGGGAWGNTVAGANYIWTPGGVSPVRYFTLKITPAPAPGAIIGFGLGIVGLVKRRRKA